MASSGITIYIPYDSTQFDYYLKLSISIISIQLSKILMFFLNSYNMIHNVDNIQPETLNLRIHCTIVTGTLLIYNKDAIKKNAIFLVFFFLDLEHSHISKKKLTCLHVHYASMTSEQTQGHLQKRKLSRSPVI